MKTILVRILDTFILHGGGINLTAGKPLIVQSNNTLLADIKDPLYDTVRDKILPFAELIKMPELVHEFKISRISLWNASASGLAAETILQILRSYSKFPVPVQVQTYIVQETGKYGQLLLDSCKKRLLLHGNAEYLAEVRCVPEVDRLITGEQAGGVLFKAKDRGELKRLLANAGYPVKDRVGYEQAETLPFTFRQMLPGGRKFQLRPYQAEAVAAFFSENEEGAGVVVLPCGAGKTVVGLAVMEKAQTRTLILAPNAAAVSQWKREILSKCAVPAEWVGEYTADNKQIRPITISTYQMLTYTKNGTSPHFKRLNQGGWGLIIYDEVHLLPAPVFRMAADLQGVKRLGLTATLVREDGAETEVFSLIGPKIFDMPWKLLEDSGWIAETECYEVEVPLPDNERQEYEAADKRQKYRIAAINTNKVSLVRSLLQRHAGDNCLVIGQYLEQLHQLAAELMAPMITGQTSGRKREELYGRFRRGELPVLVVSKVANAAIDLPDANVAIQVSGAFGSRQEEAQRLGRLLRPNQNGTASRFYTLVTKDSCEQEKAIHRQLFLTEHGYEYKWIDGSTLLEQR